MPTLHLMAYPTMNDSLYRSNPIERLGSHLLSTLQPVYLPKLAVVAPLSLQMSRAILSALANDRSGLSHADGRFERRISFLGFAHYSILAEPEFFWSTCSKNPVKVRIFWEVYNNMLVCQNRTRFPLPLRESDSDSSQISTLTGFSSRARCSKKLRTW